MANLNKSRELRVELNQKLKKEFDALHERFMVKAKPDSIATSTELTEIARCQLEMVRQIVREERALRGESPYMLPPHAFDSD